MLRFLRVVLAIGFAIIGGVLGYQTGRWYSGLDFVTGSLSGHNAGLMTFSIGGFTLIGVLLAFLVSSWALNHLVTLAESLKEMPADDKVAIVFGVLLGLLITLLIYPFLSPLGLIGKLLMVVIAVVLVYLGIQASLSMKTELRFLSPYAGTGTDARPAKNFKILDTNVIIDGRIADICRTGFLEEPIYVPGFVLDELQLIADSSDPLKRARGRRGLDILNAMQKELNLVVRTFDGPIADDHDQVDAKLVKLARHLNGTIVTNDFNLNKVAELQGVPVLNVNELANALKPVVLPGEEMGVTIIKEGKEPNQGIAYLDDGTMVVVQGANRHIGEKVGVTVASVLQTVAGKMIFANLKGVMDEEAELLNRNIRSYSGGRGGRRRP